MRFLPTNEPCQLRRVSLTRRLLHDTPNKVNSRSHKTLVFVQWRRRWSIVSSFSCHKQHLFAKAHPLFWIKSKVKVLSHVASQAKKLILGCTHTLQMQLEGKREGLSVVQLKSIVEGFDRELSALCFGPKYHVFHISMHSIPMQPLQEAFRLLHLPIIKGSWETRVSSRPTPLSQRVPISTTHASLSSIKANKEGKDTHNKESPHHLPYQGVYCSYFLCLAYLGWYPPRSKRLF